VTIHVPSSQYGHINLSALYWDAFKFGGQTTGTWLWLPSQSALAKVKVRK